MAVEMKTVSQNQAPYTRAAKATAVLVSKHDIHACF
jgi:hypothetical protein